MLLPVSMSALVMEQLIVKRITAWSSLDNRLLPLQRASRDTTRSSAPSVISDILYGVSFLDGSSNFPERIPRHNLKKQDL
jgi:hypothetical protein